MASTDLPTSQNPNDSIKRRQTQSAHDILMQMGFPKQRAYVNNVNKNITVHENKSWKMDVCWSDTLYNRPTTWVLIHRGLYQTIPTRKREFIRMNWRVTWQNIKVGYCLKLFYWTFLLKLKFCSNDVTT
jgi:hypothetical protein